MIVAGLWNNAASRFYFHTKMAQMMARGQVTTARFVYSKLYGC